ncbi:hypothetical protein THASP1DRAFT_25805 [Thamnocephalis sphaerospora]|uniref:Uncharacterized protein n=1 Tax=Thamnocephalis sphaerospora TaxID=78915 RepID=A0A4P9XK30_9FUNG|nr:hypothetical protein THASP1DRAFT_25805 [Thamnocephalis sphaerospora]|eukprot:RKP05751.1 hypothetical protein THASP1DRAFT_25805 [Thamnocephalis sphaerospora]
MQAQGDLQELRERNSSLATQSMLNVICAWIFLRSFIIAVRMIHKRARMLAGWCCLLQATAGLVYTIGGMTVHLPNGLTCRGALWLVGAGLGISPSCVGAALLQKAYIVHDYNKWLMGIGIILLLQQPFFTYLVWASPGIILPSSGCLSCYPKYLPWIKLGIDMPINLVFSVAF